MHESKIGIKYWAIAFIVIPVLSLIVSIIALLRDCPVIIIQMPSPIMVSWPSDITSGIDLDDGVPLAPSSNEDNIIETRSPSSVEINGITDSVEWKYVGEVIDGIPHGYGRKEAGNSYFEGEWVEGNYVTGKGFFILGPNAWFYGEIKNGYWINGTFTDESGTYIGDFTFDSGRHYRHGSGKMEWPNGDYYDGEWRYDLRHGEGTSYHKETDTKIDGIWINNVLQ